MTYSAAYRTVPGLSRGESLTIWAMLAHGEATERERLTLSGLSRTTYHESRRKAYGSRWIQDRYVPDPRALGFPVIAVGLSRPLVDRADEYLRTFAAGPGTVQLWSMAGCALGVFLLRNVKEAERLSQVWSDKRWVRDSDLVISEPTLENVPVYFDCEGLWAHMLQKEGTARYPRGLGTSGRGSASAAGWAPPVAGMTKMLCELPKVIDTPGPVYLHRTMGLRYSQRVMVEKGFMARRVFLGPMALPSYEGRDTNRLLFISGTTSPSFSPAAALPTLVQQANAFPHLLVGGGGKMLIGFMGQGTQSPPASNSPPSSFSTRLLPALKMFLSDINIFQGDATTMVPLIDHRYDRLVASPPLH
jgi:hypothetical protein